MGERQLIRDLPLNQRAGGLCCRELLLERRLLMGAAVLLCVYVKRKRGGRTAAARRTLHVACLVMAARTALLAAPPVERFLYTHRAPRFADLTDAEAWTNLRVRKADLPRIMAALGFEETEFRTCNGSVWHREEAVVFLLRRSGYAGRLRDLRNEFGRDTTQLSRLHNGLIDTLFTRFGASLCNGIGRWVDRQDPQNPRNTYFRTFAGKITEKTGAPWGLDNILGFIDGTVRPICRPVDAVLPGEDLQRECYNGHKRIHAVKYQSVVGPNGCVLDLCGPYCGRRHDAYLLNQ
jgi:hypothetical protein